jgi:hypothetical protein
VARLTLSKNEKCDKAGGFWTGCFDGFLHLFVEFK